MGDMADDYDMYWDREDENGGEDEYDCTWIRETEKAWLLEIDGKQEWFPRSRCEYTQTEDGTMYRRSKGTVVVPDWLMIRKGML